MDIGDVLKGIIIIGLLVLLGGFFKGCSDDFAAESSREQVWCKQHNTTPDELRIFAQIMNVQESDVIKSPGLEAEFIRFENGNLRQVGQEHHQEGKHTVTENTFQ